MLGLVIFDLTFFLIAVPAIIFGGISKGGFGSSAAFVSGAILALVVPPGMALGIVLPLFMVIDAATMRPYWKQWDTPSVRGMLIGAVPGVALAAWVYASVNADQIRLLIGVICLAFVAFQIFTAKKPILLAPKRAYAWIAGAVGGFTSFVSHAGGPPTAVYLLSQGMDKRTFQATTVITFWAINWMKFVPYLVLGVFSRETALISVLLTPFALLGAWIGVRAHHWVPERAFFTLTYVLLTATGARLIWVAVS